MDGYMPLKYGPTRQFGKGTRNGVREVSENGLWISWFPMATTMV
jgi:hypothetical protein